MECCKASNDAGARIWQAADVGYLALQYGAWLTWACLTLQLSSHLVPLLLQESSHLVPLLLQESSLHFLSFFVKTFLVYLVLICFHYTLYCGVDSRGDCVTHSNTIIHSHHTDSTTATRSKGRI